MGHYAPMIARYRTRYDVWARRQHLVALVACLVTAAGILYAPRQFVLWPDSRDYLDLARSLADGRGFSLPFLPQMCGRMPGYPALLAWSGYLANNPPGRERAPLWQALMVGVTVLALGWMGTLLADTRAGFAATCLGAGYLPLYANGIAVLTEAAVTAAFVVALALVVALLSGKGGWLAALGAGLGFGLGSLVKATVLGFPLVLAPLLAVYALKRRRRLIVPLILMYVVFAVPVVGWTVRNVRVCGLLSPSSTDGALHLWFGTRPDVAEFARHGTGYGFALPEFKALCQGEHYLTASAAARFTAAAKQNIRRDPWGVVGRGLANVAFLWLTPITMRLVPNTPLNVCLTLVRLALWAAIITGFVGAWRRGAGYPALALGLVFVYLTLSFTLILAIPRTLTPFIPAFFPLAGLGIVQLIEGWRTRKVRG